MPIDDLGSQFPNSGLSGNLPEYHPGLLMVKVRPTPTLSPAAFATFGTVLSNATAAPGLAMLAALERAGMIKSVVPVAPADEARALPSSPLATLALSAVAAEAAAAPTAASILQGLSLVALERDQDVDGVRLALAGDPNVESVDRVPIRYLVAKGGRGGRAAAGDGAGVVASVPPPASSLWNLARVQWAQARSHPAFKEPTDVQVGVLDSGVDFDHPDLKDAAGNRVVKNYTFAHPDLPGVVGFQDIIGHGTHVTGTIAAGINNNTGINGICNCFVRHWKIFQDVETRIPFYPPFNGPALVFTVDPVMYHRALARVIELRVPVINLSIGGGGHSTQEQSLFTQMIAGGTVVVAAMGNERNQFGQSPTSYPAAYPGVLAVGATRGPDDGLASFSNGGNHISLCAPGEAIWSTIPTYPGRTAGRPASSPPQPRPGGTDYAAWRGTSMAAPHATAAVAMLLAAKGAMSPSAVRSALTRTVDAVPGMAGQPFTPDFGFGRLNLFRLLNET